MTEGGCWTAVFQVSQTGITISDWEGQVGNEGQTPGGFPRTSCWRWNSHGITMQSLGSTPLLPLINTALRWKIHLAVFAVCFRKQAVPCLCSHCHALFIVAIFLFVCFSCTALFSVVAERGTCFMSVVRCRACLVWMRQVVPLFHILISDYMRVGALVSSCNKQ